MTSVGRCVMVYFLAGGMAYGQALQDPQNHPGKSVLADSLYIKSFDRKNDFRGAYISQKYLLEFGSKQSGSTTGSAVFSNVSDLLGFGLTYKFIDVDFAFSLPKTRVLQSGLQNLEQFRLAASYSGLKWSIRGYWLESTGLVASDANGQFTSSPTVHLLNLGSSTHTTSATESILTVQRRFKTKCKAQRRVTVVADRTILPPPGSWNAHRARQPRCRISLR